MMRVNRVYDAVDGRNPASTSIHFQVEMAVIEKKVETSYT